MLGQAKDADGPALDLDGEEDVELGEPDGVDNKEVHCQYPCRLRAQEPCPALATAGSRPEAGSPQDTAYGGSPHPDAQLGQLALDAHAPPTVVLPAQGDDQRNGLFSERRSSISSARPPPPPAPPRSLSVPAQQRLRLDEERSLASSRQDSGQRCHEGSVGGPVLGPAFDLALEDLQLVAEDHNLDLVLRGRAGRGGDEQLQDAAENQVDDRTEHAR